MALRIKEKPEETLARLLVMLGFPEPEREFRFHEERLWRIDLAWPPPLVACEIEGGIWQQTRSGRSKGHAHPERFLQDIEKYNALALAGWTLIRVTPEMIPLEDGRAILWLAEALGVAL